MNAMGAHGEVLRKILFGGGVAGIVVGLATMVYALGFLGPRLSSLTGELSRNLSVAAHGLALLERNAGLFDASFGVLDQTKETMRQSATALRSAAVSLRDVESPAGGLVIPGESLEESASELQATAIELDSLANGIEEVQEEGAAIDMPPVRAVLADLSAQVGETERALSGAGFPQGAVALTMMQGGIYVLLGALAVALSGMMATLDVAIRGEDRTTIRRR